MALTDLWAESACLEGTHMDDVVIAIRMPHPGATLKKSDPRRYRGRSRGGRTSKVHTMTNGARLSLRCVLTPDQAHDALIGETLLIDLKPGQSIFGDWGGV